ncbi:hypothetical protein QBC39DRAFT_385595 [Podospora conica]|nr:hypothetical protein QBC39DRAFT_385595 [Schizothecium conicum]
MLAPAVEVRPRCRLAYRERRRRKRLWASRRGRLVERESLAPRPKVEKTRTGHRLDALGAWNKSLCRKCLNARDASGGGQRSQNNGDVSS